MLKRRLLFSAGCEGEPVLVKDRRKKVIVIRALQNKRVMYRLLPSPAGGNSHADRRVGVPLSSGNLAMSAAGGPQVSSTCGPPGLHIYAP